jgi:hypothetical protein
MRKRTRSKSISSTTPTVLPRTERKNKKQKQTKATKPKPEQKGIDMTKIPKCLAEEGFSELEEIPDYLKCPICKELIVSPDVYSCGHSVCKICSDAAAITSRCPVCKSHTVSTSTPNYMMQSVVEAQFPKLVAKRKEEVEAIKLLRVKLLQYPRSTRYGILKTEFKKIIDAKPFLTLNEIHEQLSKKCEMDISEEEVKYFLTTMKTGYYGGGGDFRVIGKYICSFWPNAFVRWVKDHPADKGWIPLSYSETNTPDLTNDIAKIFNINIENTLPINDWKAISPIWLKEINLQIQEELSFCADCGNFHPDMAFYDSDSDSDF